MPKKAKLIKVERPSKDSDTLTEIEFTTSEWALINAYFDNNMNQTRAYLSVFPDTKYDSARVDASKFFSKSNIRDEIRYRLEQDAMSASEVIKRLSDIARGSHLPFIRIAEDGFIYFDFSDPEAQKYMYLIKKIETKRERRVEGLEIGGDGDVSSQTWEGEWVKVELHDAAAALRDLSRVHALFTDKTKVEGEIKFTKRVVGVDMDRI